MRARESAVKKYVVKLSAEERERLLAMIRSGKHPARKLMRARILLKADVSEAGEAWSDCQIAQALDAGLATVSRIRQQLVEEGVDGVLTPKRSPNSARKRIFDGASEAKLIALACSTPPPGYARWTLQLLEGAVVELNIVARASDNTIGTDAKKNILKPHLNDQWVIPPDANAAFVAAMEDVIEVYHRPHDPGPSRGLRGRDIEATHRRDAHADPSQAGATKTGRLRVSSATAPPTCS